MYKEHISHRSGDLSRSSARTGPWRRSQLRAHRERSGRPGEGMMRALEGRAEALAGTFKPQEVVNTLRARARVHVEHVAARG